MNSDELKDKINKLTQFPYKKRKENYQSYYIGNEFISGSRNTNERMKKMKIPLNMKGLSVLDLGCNLGEIANECSKRGSTTIMGLDYEKDYIDCARLLAEYNNYMINYLQTDLTDIIKTSNIINTFFGDKPIDIIFALSLYKHINSNLFYLLDKLNFKECIIESNNAPKGLNTMHIQEMIKHIKNRNWKYIHIGTDTTRNTRIILKVIK